MTLRLPDLPPSWMGQLAGVLSERDAKLRDAQRSASERNSPTAADYELTRTRSRIADWLSGPGRDAIWALEDRFSLLSRGYRLSAVTDLNAGTLTLTLEQSAAPVMDYRFTLEATPGGVRPSVSVRYGAGRRQGRAFRARLAGEMDLAGITANDLAADFTAALAEGESRG